MGMKRDPQHIPTVLPRSAIKGRLTPRRELEGVPAPVPRVLLMELGGPQRVEDVRVLSQVRLQRHSLYLYTQLP